MERKRGLTRHSSKNVHHSVHESSQKLPPGIKVIAAYASIIAVVYLLYLLFGATQPVSVFFGNFVTGSLATFIEFASLAVLVTIVYGLVKKHYWAFWVSLSWFVFGCFNAAVSLFTFRSEFDVLKTVLVASSFVVIIFNGIIAWYIYSERYYFKVNHLNKETRTKDKFFVYLISAFMIVSFLILITYGVDFYRTTIKTTDKLVLELKESPMPELLCAQKETGEQDICYLILSIMNEGRESKFCENINSDFYKMTCYRSLQ